MSGSFPREIARCDLVAASFRDRGKRLTRKPVKPFPGAVKRR
jgi:hypothetical protein